MDKRSKQHAHLVGIGVDHSDGHKRITQSERFSLVGGSDKTHSQMTETVIKTFEKLDQRGKTLDTVEKSELTDIIKESTPN